MAVISPATEKIATFTGHPGTLKRHKPPWACLASPPAFFVSGGVWMTCVDPTLNRAPYRRHFWHSADDGVSWRRAGALSGMTGVSDYTFGGGRLFVTGEWNGRRALLQTVEPEGTHFSATPAQGTVPGFPVKDARVVASQDGKTVAVWTLDHSQLLVGVSSDGGRSVRLAIRKQLSTDLQLAPLATLRKSSIAFEVDRDPGDPRAIVSLPLSGGAFTRTELPDGVRALCMAGRRAVAQLQNSRLAVSFDGGESFTRVGPGSTPKISNDNTVECSFRGITVSNHFAPWPAAPAKPR